MTHSQSSTPRRRRGVLAFWGSLTRLTPLTRLTRLTRLTKPRTHDNAPGRVVIMEERDWMNLHITGRPTLRCRIFGHRYTPSSSAAVLAALTTGRARCRRCSHD